MLKRSIAAITLALLAGGPLAAHADPISGTISVGHPTAVLGLGVTENLGACDPSSEVQGLDGYWVELSGETSVRLENTGDSTGLGELDIFFYDAECGWIEDGDLIAPGPIEEGDVPEGAASLVIVAFSGLDIDFTLTLS